MRWHTEKAGFWVDHVSDDGDFVIAEGYDELARKHGQPYALFAITKKAWVKVACFKSVAAAKREAALL